MTHLFTNNYLTQVDGMEVIHDVAEQDEELDTAIILKEMAEYKGNLGMFAKTFMWKALDSMGPISWWNGMCSNTRLKKLATAILNLPPTSAAIERSFSRQSWIHSAKRNRLTNKRAAMIVEIGYNAKFMEERSRVFSSLPPTDVSVQSFSSQASTSGNFIDPENDSESDLESMSIYESDEEETDNEME